MQNDQRIALLKEYIAEEPSEPFNYYALGLEYCESDIEKAIELLSNLVSDHSNYLPSYYKLAHLFWENGNFEKAKGIFEAGIQLAQTQNELKTLAELKAAYLNFEFDTD